MILWSFLFIQKQKRCFWNFRGQNHEISQIRDSHLVELVILRLTCVLYAFPFNSFPFMDSQTIATFGSKIACSDVTKTIIAPKFSVWYFWNFVRRWSIQFVTAIRSLARLAGQTGVITRRKKWGRLTPPPPSKSRVNEEIWVCAARPNPTHPNPWRFWEAYISGTGWPIHGRSSLLDVTIQ